MNDLLKNTAKFAIGTCFTVCAVTIATSVVLGSNFGKVVSVGFKGAKDAIQAELAAQKDKKAASFDGIKISSKYFED